MKITNKKLIFPITILATAVIGGGVAFALSSLDFANQAASWAKANCTSSLASSKYNTINGQKSIICYNYNKANEQDASINNLNGTTSSLNSSIPHLVDGTGKILGVASRYDTYYDSSLKLFVRLDDKSGYVADGILATYTSDNCTGKPYAVNQTSRGILMVDKQSNKYFMADQTNPADKHDKLMSFHQTGGKCVNNWGYSDDAWPLTEVTPSIAYPVSLPLSIK